LEARMKHFRPILTALSLAAAGLTAVTPALEAQNRRRDVITREEILASAHKELDLYQVIRSLRPHFLTPPRGSRTLGGAPLARVVLYINGNRQEDLQMGLRTIKPDQVQEVRYLEPGRAQDQFGLDHSGGAVLVTLYKGPVPPPPPPRN
jgi:hypothetical protein